MTANNPGPLPSDDLINQWHSDLMGNEELQQLLFEKKGWTVATLEQLGLGFDGERITIPFRDWERTENVLRYLPHRPATDTSPKMLPFSRGHGRNLYPAPETMSKDEFLFLVEGEPDAITAMSAGLSAISIPGSNGWRRSYADRLRGFKVVISVDADDAGKRLTRKVAADLVDAGVEVRILNLSEVDKGKSTGFDLGDFFAQEIAEARPDEDLAKLIADVGRAIAGWAERTTPIYRESVPPSGAVSQKAPSPVRSLSEILETIETTLKRFVVFPSEDAVAALVLWVAHTWAFEAAHATPYMLVISAEKRSGKTRLIDLLTCLVRNPWATVDVSEAALFRKISADQPTCLIDEIDALFSSAKERTEPLRSILNAGNRATGSVSRCVGQEIRVQDFPVFSPKLLAGIDKGAQIPDTVRDRSVTISMLRRTSAEKVERFLHRKVVAELQGLRLELEGWATQDCDSLLGATPDLPAELDDRSAEAWEPLFAIADRASPDWARRARSAARSLAGVGLDDRQTHGSQALEAIRSLIGSELTIASRDVVKGLNEREDLPFGGWRGGSGIDQRVLARILKPYGVNAKKVRTPGSLTLQGYHRDDLEKAWNRWLDRPTSDVPEQVEHAQSDDEASPQEQKDVPDVPEVPDPPGRRSSGDDSGQDASPGGAS